MDNYMNEDGTFTSEKKTKKRVPPAIRAYVIRKLKEGVSERKIVVELDRLQSIKVSSITIHLWKNMYNANPLNKEKVPTIKSTKKYGYNNEHYKAKRKAALESREG
jgi:IS30 family transposase